VAIALRDKKQKKALLFQLYDIIIFLPMLNSEQLQNDYGRRSLKSAEAITTIFFLTTILTMF
jgi:hypothetical protein